MRTTSLLGTVVVGVMMLTVVSPALCFAACESDSRCLSDVAHSTCTDISVSKADCSCCLETMDLPGKLQAELKSPKRLQAAAIPAAVAETGATSRRPAPSLRKTPGEDLHPADLFTLHHAFLI